MSRAATAQSFDAAERRTYLGASEIAAVMGLDKYKTPLDVWHEKAGLAEPFLGNNHTERGNALESIAADFFTHKTGIALRRRSDAFVHPEHPFIVGHVDRMVVGEKHIVEVKCPSIAAFRRFQRDGLPQSYIIQANVYMGLAKAEKLTFCIFCADAWDAAVFTLDFDQAIYNAAITSAAAFWTGNVIANTPPDADKKNDDIEIASHGGSVTHRDDEPFLAKAAAVREAIQLKRDADELFDLAKQDLIDAVEGTCGIYECPGLRIYYTEQAGRKSLDKKAVTAAGIDLSPYEKQGAPFKTFKTYVLNTQGEN